MPDLPDHLRHLPPVWAYRGHGDAAAVCASTAAATAAAAAAGCPPVKRLLHQ